MMDTSLTLPSCMYVDQKHESAIDNNNFCASWTHHFPGDHISSWPAVVSHNPASSVADPAGDTRDWDNAASGVAWYDVDVGGGGEATPITDVRTSGKIKSGARRKFGKRGKSGKGGRCVKSGRSASSFRHVPHREKPPQIVERRNARERRRVQAVNIAFVKLRKVVPIDNNRGKRVSKVKTLQKAIEYISQLQSLLLPERHHRANRDKENTGQANSNRWGLEGPHDTLADLLVHFDEDDF